MVIAPDQALTLVRIVAPGAAASGGWGWAQPYQPVDGDLVASGPEVAVVNRSESPIPEGTMAWIGTDGTIVSVECR